MLEVMADGGRRLVTLDDLIDALDKRERAPSNVPKIGTFHFKGDRVSDWLDLTEQALVGLSDEVKLQGVLSWIKFGDLMRRKYGLGDDLLTMDDLEAMNKEDLSTIGAFVHEFTKKARKVHGISEEAQCATFLGLLMGLDAAKLTKHGEGSEKLTWEEEEEGDDEEDERLRQEEDRRAEQRAKKRGVQGEAEPSLRDGAPKRKKYAVRLEEGFDVERMVDKLLEGHNDLMNLKDILASAPRLRGELKGRLSRRLVPNVHLSSILPTEIEWTEARTGMDWKCVACGLVDLKVRDQPSIAMVDTDAEMNIIRERDASMLGLEVDHSDHGVLHGANCKAIFCGTASNVVVEIGRVRERMCFFVMPDVDHPILLGRLFLCRMETLVFNRHEGMMIQALSDPACGKYEISSAGTQDLEVGEKGSTLAPLPSRSLSMRDENSGRNRRSGREDEEAYYERERGLIRRMRERAQAGPCRINDGTEEGLIMGEPGFLSPQERTVMVGTMKRRHCAYAFNDDKRGRFDMDKIPMIRIHTVPHEPWNVRSALYPNPDEKKKVVDYLDRKMRTYVADYSSGPYASPWFCFIKPNRTLRWVQDLQRLNAVTVRDAGGLPNTDALSDSCAGRPIISLMDLYSGYDQCPVYPPNRPVMAMHTLRGLIHMNVAPQGWTNAVAMVQRHMIRVMQTISPHITQPYIDDLAVKGPKEREEDEVMPGVRRFIWKHIQDIDKVLGLLEAHNLTASGPESKHCMREATILGFVCNEKGRRPDVKKTDKILEWPVPFQSITDVRSFLGTCGFWRSFVNDFTTKTEHLRKLVRQDQEWVWGEDQEKAVERMKGEFKEGGLVLGAPNYEAAEERSFVVETDAGPIALGGILIQADADGKERPLRSDFSKAVMQRGGRDTRPRQGSQRAAGRGEQHEPPRREPTPEFDDDNIELFLDVYRDHAAQRGWSVAERIHHLRVEFRRITSEELRPSSPSPSGLELDVPGETPFRSLATHLDVSRWEASRLGEGSAEPVRYVPLEEPLDLETEQTRETKRGPQGPGMAVKQPGPVRPLDEEVITVGDDTPPCSPAPEQAQHSWPKGIPEPGSEEISEFPPETTAVPDQRDAARQRSRETGQADVGVGELREMGDLGFSATRMAIERVDKKICETAVTSFQWYSLLSRELRVRELEVEHLTTQLAEERARNQAREIEWERRFREMAAIVDRLSAAWEASQTGRVGADGQDRGMRASPSQEAAVGAPRQAGPIGEVPLDTTEEEGGAQESLMAISTERRGSRLHELAAAMGIGTPQERPQRLDTLGYTLGLGELRAELGSWALETDSGGSSNKTS
ncbi:hypothetical protein CBR_g37802 [Chara braunii]|uniref:Reverse transcriptase domain-containing protein n=1 Tax=Chara braunii TaxID=69332 RepID=A0A388LNT5_CHABU|nr:hypothetical protein CBR_g37802 [Chara braunii]|eukprot:GBG83931.1 hypothetical protein CBR_g37802 [Chara braunii]